MGLTDTPSANRLQIGLYGRRNSGKSSLLNALTGQEVSLVSEVAGTTTDPVAKAMEWHPLGPVLFYDTAGFDDEGELGAQRVERTEKTLEKVDVALLVFAGEDIAEETAFARRLKEKHIPTVAVLNQTDLLSDEERDERLARIGKATGLKPVAVSARERRGMEQVREALIRAVPEDFGARSIVGGLAGPGDTVLLVMPQDIQAPKGRLILPQVQTIRELLDKGCVVVSSTADQMEKALASLAAPPHLIVTDSQCFPQVYRLKPEESLLTSFSVLFAAYKGDIRTFVEGASAIASLNEHSHVLIAEACTHAPQQEDIGRVKIPRMLRQRFGESLQVTLVAGADFPGDLTPYDLIIHCGACMFNRRYVLSRVEAARSQGVPITNYGVTLAYLAGILDKVSYEE